MYQTCWVCENMDENSIIRYICYMGIKIEYIRKYI